jgi:hypothetical protein
MNSFRVTFPHKLLHTKGRLCAVLLVVGPMLDAPKPGHSFGHRLVCYPEPSRDRRVAQT